MSESVENTVDGQLRQLENARKLVLGNASYYPQITSTVVTILQPQHATPIRRWGAQFLAEVFSSPVLSSSQKETLCLPILENFKNLLSDANEDMAVLRSIISTCASIYPLVLNWVLGNSYDGPTWERMIEIKSRIFQLWDNSQTTLRICCIKFAQRVILAQTQGSMTSEKIRGDIEFNLNKIPPNHPLLNPGNLEAEAAGLLDRILGIIHENCSDPLLVDSTLNAVTVLVRTRPAIANRIMVAIMAFNPLNIASAPLTSKTKTVIKSLEKTTRMLLMHLAKRDIPSGSAARLQQHAEHLMRARLGILDEPSRKRPLANGAAQDDPKRQRLMAADDRAKAAAAANTTLDLDLSLLTAGPHSIAELFTLVREKDLARLDVTMVPAPYVSRILVTAFTRIDVDVFSKAIAAVRSRYDAMIATAVPESINANTAPLGVDADDDDDYEPELDDAVEDAEQLQNKNDDSPKLDGDMPTVMATTGLDSVLGLGTVTLPSPPTLLPVAATRVGQAFVQRTMSLIRSLEEQSTAVVAARGKPERQPLGLHVPMQLTMDKDSWITLLVRAATRGGFPLEEAAVLELAGNPQATAAEIAALASSGLADYIRECMYDFVVADFRRRIDAAVVWLHEEWFADQMAVQFVAPAPAAKHAGGGASLDGLAEGQEDAKDDDNTVEKNESDNALNHDNNNSQAADNTPKRAEASEVDEAAHIAEAAASLQALVLTGPAPTPLPPTSNYARWTLRVMDGFLPYVNPQDKVLIRFLSELPELTREMLARIKRLCRDPAMVQLVTTSLHYLVTLRPPVRELVLDTLEEVWLEYEDARPFAGRHISKWRPNFAGNASTGIGPGSLSTSTKQLPAATGTAAAAVG